MTRKKLYLSQTVELSNGPLNAISNWEGQLMMADCYQNVWWECNKHFCNPTKNEQKYYKSTQYHVHSYKNGLVWINDADTCSKNNPGKSECFRIAH